MYMGCNWKMSHTNSLRMKKILTKLKKRAETDKAPEQKNVTAAQLHLPSRDSLGCRRLLCEGGKRFNLRLVKIRSANLAACRKSRCSEV